MKCWPNWRYPAMILSESPSFSATSSPCHYQCQLIDSACSARAAIPLGTRGSHVEGPHSPGTSLGGVPREQKMLKGHLPRVIYHQVY